MSDPATEAHSAAGADETPEAAYVPPLPIEKYLVPGVRALEALKGQVELLLMLLEHAPDEGTQITAARNALADYCNAATGAIYRFQEVRSCRGRPQ